MLSLVRIDAGWTRYKSEVAIEPGNYYHFAGRPDEQTRRRFGLIAASKGRQFAWLAPYERWVKVLADDYTPPECALWGDGRATFSDWTGLGFDPAFIAQLRPHQRQWLIDAIATLRRGGQYRRAAIWSLGAGKSLGALLLTRLVDSAAVLAPRYVHQTWLDEARKWGFPPPIITTYESAHKLPTVDLLICDEVMAAKNPDAQRTSRAAEVSRRASICVGLTGTPTGGCGPLDLRWLRVIQPGSVPASDNVWRHQFGLDTELVEVAPGRKAYVTRRWDMTKVDRLVGPYINAIDAKDLVEHLPEVEWRTIRTQMPRDYTAVLAGVATERKAKRTAQSLQASDGFIYNDLGAPIRLSTEKIDATEQFVANLGEPVLIYAAWRETISMLSERWPNAAVLTGDESDPGAQIGRFTSGLTDVLIANARFSCGMNLQNRCRIVIYVSPSTNPTDLKQGVGRVYRPGQKRGVVVVRVVAEGTRDDRVWDLIEHHNELSEQAILKLLEKDK